MTNDNLETSKNILQHIGKGYILSIATSVVTQESGRTFILTNDASWSPRTGQLGIITRLQKYGKLADGKKNINDRAGSKA